jgi:flagellum-specific peptidoglycan hydrolase FlgJ
LDRKSRKSEKSKKSSKSRKSSKKHRKFSDSSKSSDSNSYEKSKKTDKKQHSIPEEQFTAFIKSRLGPLVEYNPDDQSMKFTAKRRFNDSKVYDEKIKQKMRSQMEEDAKSYRNKKMEVGEILSKYD